MKKNFLFWLLTGLAFHLCGQEITYLNPFPTSLKLFDAAFPEPDVICLVGDRGLILRSTDNGQSFERPASGTEDEFRRIQFFDSSRGIASGRAAIRGTTDGGKNWFPIPIPTVGFLHQFFFTSPVEGWAAGYDVLLHTEDGGQNWNLALEIPMGPIRSLWFVSPEVGWIVGDGILFRTTDGGQNWEEQNLGTTNPPFSIYFFNENKGWFSTFNREVFITNDGGASWTLQFIANQAVSSIHFSDDQHGVMACTEANTPALLYWTDNGGDNWNEYTPEEVQEMESVRMDSHNTLWALGDKGVIFTSNNGGSSWERLSQGITAKMGCSYWPDNSEGWVFGDWGNYLHTTSGGGSWELESIFNEEHFFDLDATDPNHIWVVGYDGVMFRTTDGGENWIYTDNGFDNRDMYSVDFVDNNTGYIAGSSGMILKTTDGGQNWQDLSLGPQALYAVDFINPDTGWVSGFGKFLRTIDGGQSWSNQYPGTDEDLWDLFFLDEQFGWGVGNHGAIVRTTDGGNSWEALLSPTTDYLRAVHFLDESFGLVAGVAKAYITQDGGLTWKPTRPITDLIDDVYIVDANNIYATGTDGTIARISPFGLANISGFVFHDANSNGIREANEEPLAEQIVSIDPLGFATASNNFGFYQIGISSQGPQSASLTNLPPYTSLTTPVSYDFQVNNFLEEFTFDFGVEIQPGVQDLRVELIATEARPGFECTYFLTVRNIGTATVLQPSVNLIHDVVLSPIESTLPFNTISNTHITWQLDSLQRWESQDFSITFLVENDISINGMELTGIAEILPFDTDFVPADNLDTVKHVVVASYDPNDKLVEPEGQGEEGRIPLDTEELEYTIRFQNTGTASAINVVVRDTLDASVLDISSLEMLAASHDYILRMEGAGIVEWAFPNIDLPYQDEDESGSQGAVKFHIKLQPGLSHDTRIENRAGIYFDFNPPIITNTTMNTMGLLSGLENEQWPKPIVRVYPIPFSHAIHFGLSSLGSQAEAIEIYTPQGSALHRQQLNGERTLRINTGHWQPGIYYFEIKDKQQGRLASGKLVKCQN